jgi:hypothetical protein
MSRPLKFSGIEGRITSRYCFLEKLDANFIEEADADNSLDASNNSFLAKPSCFF